MTTGQVIYGALDLTADPYILDPDSDMGAPAPDIGSVSRLLADGDVVAGVRSGNRQFAMVVSVASDSRAAFAEAEAALFAEVDKPLNTLTVLFGAGDGLPVVADTYRGTLTPRYDQQYDYNFFRTYSLTFSAEPFLRSPDPIGIAPSSDATQIDALESTTGLTCSSTPSVDTATFVRGTGSIKQAVTLAVTGAITEVSASWSRAISSLDLSTAATVQLWLLTDLPSWGAVKATTLTLSSSGGKSTTWPVQAFDPDATGWTNLTFDLLGKTVSTAGGGVNLAAVTGWTVALDQSVYAYGGLSGTFHVWADDLRAYPHGSAATTAGSAQLFFADIKGAARTPISLQVDTSVSCGGLLVANTPNPPPGYDPVLLAVTNTPPVPITVTRKAVTLRRPAPECCTYIVVLYGHLLAGTYTATATDGSDPTTVASTCTRVVTTSDADYQRRNGAGYALFAIGELTLPATDVDPQNTASTVTITITGTGDVNGAWLVWAGGENLKAFLATGGVRSWYLDALTPGKQDGRLLASTTVDARSVAYDVAKVRQGAATVHFTPGPNHLLVAALPVDSSPTTNPTPTPTLSYYSRWLTERTA